MHGCFIFIHDIRIAVGTDNAVLEIDDAGRILFRQFRVVRNHDNQAVARDFLKQIHDLHAGFRVQRTGRFIRKQNIRIIDQRTRNRHPLHLSAGHLARLLVRLFPKTHFFQCLQRALFPFSA